jgi:AcrR family transcriptional regulator
VTQQTRSYASKRRALQSEQTRSDILAAAASLFASRGWRGTTIAGIAEAAGVAIDTVYASFGSKSALLAAAKDAAKAGDEEDVPMFDRPAYRGLGEGTRELRLARAAQLIAEVNERTAPLDAAWREAASSDQAIAARLAEREVRRRDDLVFGLTRVLGRAPDDATLMGLWAITSPEVYAKLTHAGWDRDAYESWLAATLDRLC